jgi:16S rRNA C1402 (ribose-2'-O) methylase RsmI
VASGLPTDEFHFIGFLPEKAGARRTRLEALAAEMQKNRGPRTLIFYEAPHRILETLADLEAVFGPAVRVVLARELTKIHEEFLRGRSRRRGGSWPAATAFAARLPCWWRRGRFLKKNQAALR